MPSNWQVRITMPYITGLPRDCAINTFSVISVDDPPVLTPFSRFYTVPDVGGGATLGSMMSNQISRTPNACTVEAYAIDLATGATGFPVSSVNFSMPAASSGDDLPLEQSICTSIAAAAPSGVNPARRRGRVFVGPFNINIGNGLRVQPGTRTQFATITKRLLDEVLANGDALSIWSRADHALYPVIRGWVDNDWDTQRRRQEDASARTTWTA